MEQLNVDSQLNCSIEGDKYQKGDNEELDKVKWEKGTYDLSAPEGKVKFVNIKVVMDPMPKLLSEWISLLLILYY